MTIRETASEFEITPRTRARRQQDKAPSDLVGFKAVVLPWFAQIK